MSGQIFTGRKSELGAFRGLLKRGTGQLGFYGIAGIGKSSLLRQMAIEARASDALVCEVDLAGVRSIADVIESIHKQLAEQVPRPRLLGLPLPAWTARDPLQPMEAALRPAEAGTTQNVLIALGSTLTNVQQRTLLSPKANEETAGSRLLTALLSSLVKLAERLADGDGRAPIVLFFDSIDEAPDSLALWLVRLVRSPILSVAAVVAAGRNRREELTETELASLPDWDSSRLLVEASIPDSLHGAILATTRGHPLCLALAVHYAQTNDAARPEDFRCGEAEVEMIVQFLYHKYLERLRDDYLRERDPEKRENARRLYTVLRYASALHRLDADMLHYVLGGLPGLGDTFSGRSSLISPESSASRAPRRVSELTAVSGHGAP